MSADKQPTVDQDGKMINPHNPDFITKVPWYLGNTGPTLKHHSVQKNNHELSITETDALVAQKINARSKIAAGSQRTTFRKGACKNCGSMTHKDKDCLERPRSSKKSAWKSGLDIAPDDVVLDLENHGKLSYAAKRDQYKGYNPDEFTEIVDKHNRLEEERKKQQFEEKEQEREAKQQRKALKALKKQEKQEKPSKSHSNSDSDYNSDSDNSDNEDGGDDKEEAEFRQQDANARDFQGEFVPQGGVGGHGMRITARNLRTRDDTPKYLRNLSLDSAFYDAKSRSMRANPYANDNNTNLEDLPFAGDNFIRYTGDALKLAQNQVLCWEMQKRGEEGVDFIANPSQVELLQRDFQQKKEALQSEQSKQLLQKYLGPDYEKQLKKQNSTFSDVRLRLGQTEVYTEYDRHGRPLVPTFSASGGNVIRKTTKYEEDVFVNNHSTVYGSYYNRAKACWGYACCHAVLKNAYCTGAAGMIANDAASNESMLVLAGQATAKAAFAKKKEELSKQPSDIFGASSSSSAAVVSAMNDEADSSAKKKRGYNSMQAVEKVTDADMEDYHRKRSKADDPMAAYVDNNDD